MSTRFSTDQGNLPGLECASCSRYLNAGPSPSPSLLGLGTFGPHSVRSSPCAGQILCREPASDVSREQSPLNRYRPHPVIAKPGFYNKSWSCNHYAGKGAPRPDAGVSEQQGRVAHAGVVEYIISVASRRSISLPRRSRYCTGLSIPILIPGAWLVSTLSVISLIHHMASPSFSMI
jgi:hypothetical protein